MNVFIGMECSQVIQQAFERRGHNAWSCDLKPAVVNPERHIQGDVHKVLNRLPLIGLTELQPTRLVAPRMVDGRPRWSNQTDSGQNRLGPTKDPEDRRAARAVTYPGPAEAMAAQWGQINTSLPQDISL